MKERIGWKALKREKRQEKKDSTPALHHHYQDPWPLKHTHGRRLACIQSWLALFTGTHYTCEGAASGLLTSGACSEAL